MASLLLGLPQNFTLRQTEVLDRSSWYVAGFAQTDWAVHSDFTLNLGIRWEVDTPIKDRTNRMNGLDPTAINPVSGTPGVVKFMGQDGFRNTPYDADLNNFGPRFGFAWKPFGSTKTVVRGGWGIFFAHPFDAGAPTSAALGFEQSANLTSPDNGITFPFVLGEGVPGISLTSPTRDDSFGAVPVGSSPNTAVTFFETNRATGYSMQHNFGVQRELPGNMMVEVTYLANLSQPDPEGAAWARDLAARPSVPAVFERPGSASGTRRFELSRRGSEVPEAFFGGPEHSQHVHLVEVPQ
jgi:hypothetical protein